MYMCACMCINYIDARQEVRLPNKAQAGVRGTGVLAGWFQPLVAPPPRLPVAHDVRGLITERKRASKREREGERETDRGDGGLLLVAVTAAPCPPGFGLQNEMGAPAVMSRYVATTTVFCGIPLKGETPAFRGPFFGHWVGGDLHNRKFQLPVASNINPTQT